MLTPAIDAKRLIAKYQKLAAPQLEAIREIENDHGRSTASKAEKIGAIRPTLEKAYQETHAQLRALVDEAQQALRDNSVGATQRRKAMAKTDSIARATSIRSLLAGASDIEVFRAAQQAAAENDSAAAYGIRLELEARQRASGTKGPSNELAAKILDELRFDALADAEQAAIQELVLTRYFEALFLGQGPLLDGASSRRSPLDRITAFRAAARVELESGKVVEYRQPEINAMLDAMELGDHIAAPTRPQTPAERMADFRRLLQEDQKRSAQTANDTASRLQREQAERDTKAGDRGGMASAELERLDALKLKRDADGPALVQ